MKWTARLIVFILLFMFLPTAHAQGELAASLEVLSAGVEVKRVNTEQWVSVRIESLIGEGDSIRTDGTGTASIIFFNDGTELTLEPGTELTVLEFRGDSTKFNISLRMLAGITRQQILRALEADAVYSVETPAVNMTVRGTVFAVRVEDTGRSSVVTSDGEVAVADSSQDAGVPAGFGLRVPVNQRFSEVVPATTFEELDAALDGCAATFQTESDVRVNIRLGPDITFARVGSIAPGEINNLVGVTENGEWYRVAFRGGFGWISGAGFGVNIAPSCAGLRIFENDYEEDVTGYAATGDGDAVVVTAVANLRAGPGTFYPQLGSVADGSELDITGKSTDGQWVQVLTRDGRAGWIALYLIRLNIDITDIPVIAVSPATPTATPAPTSTTSGGS